MFSGERKIIYVISLVIYLSTMCESVPNRKEYYFYPNFTDLLSYKLEYTPNFESKTFTLRCIWKVKNSNSVNDYQFYSKNLDVQFNKTRLTKSYCDKIYKRETNAEYRPFEPHPDLHEIQKFSYEGQYSPGTYNLDFKEVRGSLENNLLGFYYDEYFDENGVINPYLITQFGPIGARYAFPCWDEPKYRAIFKIKINRPKTYDCVISNVQRKTSIPKGNLIADTFEASEKISPSSVSFLVSNLQLSDRVPGSIHQIVARPEIINLKQHEYVFNLINRIYKEVETFLHVSCEQKFLYHVALPSNKMRFESLGTYRGVNHYKESVLIFTNETSADIQESSTIAITKLIAQQWFLSYLMIDRWTSVWINEALSMFLSYNITAKLYPSWEIEERLRSDTRISMQDDSRCCYKSINHEAQKRPEIEEKFNRITVYKGAALITMMERILPPGVFTSGLTRLVQKKKWSTYTSQDLYAEIETILNLNNLHLGLRLPNKLSTVMSPWESNTGYPVITVTRNYSIPAIDHFFISQNRFHFDGNSKPVWSVPINYATKSKPNFKNTKPTVWLKTSTKKVHTKLLKKSDWLILNKQATYYYRVQYDTNNWNIIGKALKSNLADIHYLNRMQIIDDAFSLAEFGMLKYSIAFKISQYIKNERAYAPLKAMKGAVELIHKKLANSIAYHAFRKFIRTSVEHIFEATKRDIVINDSPPPRPTVHRQQLTFKMLLSWLCDLRSKKCVIDRMDKLDARLIEQIKMDLEKHALCTTARKADRSHWNQLFNDHKKSLKNRRSQNNNNNTIAALGCSGDVALQEMLLTYIMKLEKDQLIEVIKLLIKQEGNGLDLVLKYLSTLFDDLLKTFSFKNIKDLLNEIGSRVTSEKQLEILIDFSKKQLSYSYLIKSSLSLATHNIEWRKKHLRGFQNQFQSSKSIGTKYCNNILAFVLIISYWAN